MTAKEAKAIAMSTKTMSWAGAAYITLQKDIKVAANVGALGLNRILDVGQAEKGDVIEVVEQLMRDGFDVEYKPMEDSSSGQFKISWE